MLTRPESRSYLIASLGALIAAFTFLFLPFGAITYQMAGSQRGITITAGDFTSNGAWFTLPLGVVWLSVLLLLAIIGIALYTLTQNTKSNTSEEVYHSRWAGETITTLGIASLVLYLWSYFLVILRIQGVYPAQMQAGVSLGIGSLLTIFFLLVTIAGGVLTLTNKRKARKQGTGQLTKKNNAQA